MANQKIKVEGLSISISKDGYMSLTDIAKQEEAKRPDEIIRNWLRNQKTLSYLFAWEEVNNPNFNPVHMHTFRSTAEKNRIIISAKMFIEQTGAIGITSTVGRYGGTFAHSDIALDFCKWLDPRFSVYVNKEFQRLKADEQLRLGDPYNIKRFLATGSYSILVTSILSQMDERLLTHPQPYKGRLPFSKEADMLNIIVFGESAKQWRANNPNKPADRNQRDFATILELTILNHLEFLDGMLIQWDVDSIKERETILQNTYDFIKPILRRSKTLQKLQSIADNQNAK